jgi:hypothetical protein
MKRLLGTLRCMQAGYTADAVHRQVYALAHAYQWQALPSRHVIYYWYTDTFSGDWHVQEGGRESWLWCKAISHGFRLPSG